MLPLKSKLFNCEAILISILFISELSSLFSSRYFVCCCFCTDKALFLLKTEMWDCVISHQMEQVYPSALALWHRAFLSSTELIIFKEQQLCTGLVIEINSFWYAQGVQLAWQEGTVVEAPASPGWNPNRTTVNVKPLPTAVRLRLHRLDHRYVSVPGGSLLPRIILFAVWLLGWREWFPVCSLVNSYVQISEVTVAFGSFSIRIKIWKPRNFFTFGLLFLEQNNNKFANDKLWYPASALTGHSDHALGKRGGLHNVLASCNLTSCDYATWPVAPTTEHRTWPVGSLISWWP